MLLEACKLSQQRWSGKRVSKGRDRVSVEDKQVPISDLYEREDGCVGR